MTDHFALETFFRAVVVSLMVVSLSISMEDEQLLHGLQRRLRLLLPPNKYPMLHKPVYGCVGCMASFWGGIFYLLTAPIFGFHPLEMAVVMIMGVALNFIFIKLS
jgi:hypothetical protein